MANTLITRGGGEPRQTKEYHVVNTRNYVKSVGKIKEGKMKHLAITLGMVVTLATVTLSGNAESAYAGQVYEVTITNITRSQVITPPVLVSHNKYFNLFTTGASASDELTALAEDGVTDPLVDRSVCLLRPTMPFLALMESISCQI
jgi:hypothetical protein